MRDLLRTAITTFGMAFLTAGFTLPASAGCGEVPANLEQQARPRLMQAAYRPARFMLASDSPAGAGIVGLWSIRLTALGNTGIPDGALVDWGYAQWHGDGTEIMNSGGRSPASQNFCLGVWARTGAFTYKLNHVALSYDPATGALNGTVSVHENVTLDRNGSTFAGTFSIDVYPPGGGPAVAHLVGEIQGERVTADQ